MLRIQRPTKRTEYILEEDRASSAPTVFVLRPLTWDQFAEASAANPLTPEQAQAQAAIYLQAQREGRELTVAEIVKMEQIAPKTPEYRRGLTKQYAIAVRYGVVEIKGAVDDEGKPWDLGAVEFSTYALGQHIQEVGMEIMRISGFIEDAIKK